MNNSDTNLLRMSHMFEHWMVAVLWWLISVRCATFTKQISLGPTPSMPISRFPFKRETNSPQGRKTHLSSSLTGHRRRIKPSFVYKDRITGRRSNASVDPTIADNDRPIRVECGRQVFEQLLHQTKHATSIGQSWASISDNRMFHRVPNYSITLWFWLGTQTHLLVRWRAVTLSLCYKW